MYGVLAINGTSIVFPIFPRAMHVFLPRSCHNLVVGEGRLFKIEVVGFFLKRPPILFLQPVRERWRAGIDFLALV
jgi:hypothetical protein